MRRLTLGKGQLNRLTRYRPAKLPNETKEQVPYIKYIVTQTKVQRHPRVSGTVLSGTLVLTTVHV